MDFNCRKNQWVSVPGSGDGEFQGILTAENLIYPKSEQRLNMRNKNAKIGVLWEIARKKGSLPEPIISYEYNVDQ